MEWCISWARSPERCTYWFTFVCTATIGSRLRVSVMGKPLAYAPWGFIYFRAKKGAPGRLLCGRGVTWKLTSGLFTPRCDTKKQAINRYLGCVRSSVRWPIHHYRVHISTSCHVTLQYMRAYTNLSDLVINNFKSQNAFKMFGSLSSADYDWLAAAQNVYLYPDANITM